LKYQSIAINIGNKI